MMRAKEIMNNDGERAGNAQCQSETDEERSHRNACEALGVGPKL